MAGENKRGQQIARTGDVVDHVDTWRPDHHTPGSRSHPAKKKGPTTRNEKEMILLLLNNADVEKVLDMSLCMRRGYSRKWRAVRPSAWGGLICKSASGGAARPPCRSIRAQLPRLCRRHIGGARPRAPAPAPARNGRHAAACGSHQWTREGPDQRQAKLVLSERWRNWGAIRRCSSNPVYNSARERWLEIPRIGPCRISGTDKGLAVRDHSSQLDAG